MRRLSRCSLQKTSIETLTRDQPNLGSPKSPTNSRRAKSTSFDQLPPTTASLCPVWRSVSLPSRSSTCRGLLRQQLSAFNRPRPSKSSSNLKYVRTIYPTTRRKQTDKISAGPLFHSRPCHSKRSTYTCNRCSAGCTIGRFSGSRDQKLLCGASC